MVSMIPSGELHDLAIEIRLACQKAEEQVGQLSEELNAASRERSLRRIAEKSGTSVEELRNTLDLR